MLSRNQLPVGTLVVGVLGAGQLARMMAEAASALGIQFRVFAESATDCAALVCADTVIGDLADTAAVFKFAQSVDVITLDHELVPPATLNYLEQHGIKLYPSATAINFAADKSAMRSRLAELGAPMPNWALATNLDQAIEFANQVSYPLIAKSPTGGYDGKGVWLIHAESEFATAKYPMLLEQKVEFQRELAALVVRSPHNQAVVYPIVETVQQAGICHQVIAPAQNLATERALAGQQLALKIAAELDVIGVLAVELFDTGNGELLVNELAMRPHNSGHWTQDGARTSQFENHLRAVLDLPLGSPDPIAQLTVMGNVLGGTESDLHRGLLHCLAKDPELKIHFYGKAIKPNRKVGHINLTGSDLSQLQSRVAHATDFLAGKIDH